MRTLGGTDAARCNDLCVGAHTFVLPMTPSIIESNVRAAAAELVATRRRLGVA